MDTQLITTTVSAITLVTEIFNVAKEFSTPYRKWKIRAKIKDELYEQEYRKSINANISKFLLALSNNLLVSFRYRLINATPVIKQDRTDTANDTIQITIIVINSSL